MCTVVCCGRKHLMGKTVQIDEMVQRLSRMRFVDTVRMVGGMLRMCAYVYLCSGGYRTTCNQWHAFIGVIESIPDGNMLYWRN